MLLYTHLLFALFLSLVYSHFTSLPIGFLFLTAALVGSFVPDIDNPKSTIGKKFFIFSYLLRFTIGHRSFFHTVWMAMLVSIPLFFITDNLAFAFFLGYLSHLMLDALTPSGVKFFYPLPYRINGCIKSGSLFEIIFSGLLLLGIIYLSLYIL